MTVLVTQESVCRSVWAYAVKSKGAKEDWVIVQICEDLETVGIQNYRVILKNDGEAAILEVQREIAKRRSEYGSAIENSKVGDSNSNATMRERPRM